MARRYVHRIDKPVGLQCSVEGHGGVIETRNGRLYCPHQGHDGEWTKEGKYDPSSPFIKLNDTQEAPQ